MFLSPWYNSMLVIIFATVIYQAYWMRSRGYKFKQKTTIDSRVFSFILMFVPILNTIFGLACMFLLYTYIFKEDYMMELFDNSIKVEKR